MKAFTSVVVALAVAACTNAYSTGAPESACKDMIPRHPVPPQSSSPPYTITTSTKVTLTLLTPTLRYLIAPLRGDSFRINNLQ